MKTNPTLLFAVFRDFGLPLPRAEFQFLPERRWRFDFAWPAEKVALEIDGGIWTRGAHVRGARIKRTWERDNLAASLGWSILRCEPKDATGRRLLELLAATLHLKRFVALTPAPQQTNQHHACE